MNTHNDATRTLSIILKHSAMIDYMLDISSFSRKRKITELTTYSSDFKSLSDSIFKNKYSDYDPSADHEKFVNVYSMALDETGYSSEIKGIATLISILKDSNAIAGSKSDIATEMFKIAKFLVWYQRNYKIDKSQLDECVTIADTLFDNLNKGLTNEK